MGGKVTVRGMDQLVKRLAALPEAVDRAARRAVRDETEAVADDMRAGAPRGVTGGLVEGIQAEFDEATIAGKAVSTADHSTFVEHGTSKQAAQPFIAPAEMRARRRFPRRMSDEIKTEMRRLAE